MCSKLKLLSTVEVSLVTGRRSVGLSWYLTQVKNTGRGVLLRKKIIMREGGGMVGDRRGGGGREAKAGPRELEIGESDLLSPSEVLFFFLVKERKCKRKK